MGYSVFVSIRYSWYSSIRFYSFKYSLTNGIRYYICERYSLVFVTIRYYSMNICSTIQLFENSS